MGDKCNCYRFSPRDSLSGVVAQISDYLSKHPGWNETELRAFVDGLISATGVESFNGRTGAVILDKNDVNNLKIASAYFAERDESIDSLDLVSLYNQGVRFVFTDFNSVTSGYNLAFALEYFSGSGNVVYYPMSTTSGGGGNIVSVNGKTGAVRLKVVDVSNGNSPDENAYIFIDESDDYPDVVSPDSNKLGGQLPSYYASAEEVSQLKNDIRVNLLSPTQQTTTINGVTCTNNGDGTYTLNGTASGETMFVLYSDLVPYSKIKMVGCPNDGSLATFNLLCQNTSTWDTYNDIGNGIVIDIDKKTVYRISIVVQNGATVSNIVFKPMITTDLSATYDDFVSYDDSFVSVRDVIDKASIGDAWVSGKTYAVGDYCISVNRLYKCKTAHTAGSAFDAAYWDATSVAAELAKIINALNISI